MYHSVYQAWIYYGEFLVLGVWGILLALVRRILFGELCRDAALGSNGKGKLLKAMTLKFEKSYEVKVGIFDMPVFVQKYLCQERKLGIRLGRWRRLPERWTGLILGVGFVEAMVLRYLKYDSGFVLNRFLASATMAALVWMAVLIFETDSLWEQTRVLLLDYVSNTLYPRQVHVYEGFEEEEKAEQPVKETVKKTEKKAALKAEKPAPKEPKKGIVLKKEEEQIFQEVLSDFLGSST